MTDESQRKEDRWTARFNVFEDRTSVTTLVWLVVVMLVVFFVSTIVIGVFFGAIILAFMMVESVMMFRVMSRSQFIKIQVDRDKNKTPDNFEKEK